MLPLIQQSIQLQATPSKVSIKRSAPIEVAIHNGTENNVLDFDQLELTHHRPISAMADTDPFSTAIQFAISTGKIQSASEIDLSKSTTGIDSVILRNEQGITVASISKRILKERAENDAVAKLKSEQTNQL